MKPRNTETLRPYRLWDPKLGVEVRWHYFGKAINAHYAALKLLHSYQAVGTTYELLNVCTGALLAQYTRTTTGIRFHKEQRHG